MYSAFTVCVSMLIGLEDVDQVSALKKQMADLQEKANLLAAHLQHTKYLASRAVHTTAELQAQNVEMKQELLSISSEFEMYKENCTSILSEYENKRIEDRDAMAALLVERKEIDRIIGQLRSQLEAKEQTIDMSRSMEILQGQLDKANQEKAALVKKNQDVVASGLAAKAARDKLVLETELELKASQAALAITSKQLNSLQSASDNERAELQARLAALQTQLDKINDEKTALIKKSNDITSSSVAGKSLRDKLILETETELAALRKEHGSYKTTSEQTIADLNTSLSKVKDEYAQHLTECKLAADKTAKKLNSVTSSAVAAKSTRDKMIREMELELKASQDACAVATKQLNSLQGASDKERAELQAQLTVLQTQIDKGNDEKAALVKKNKDVVASGIAAKAARDKLVLETELELKASQAAHAVATKQLNSLQSASDKERAELQAQLTVLQSQIDKSNDEKAALVKKTNDVTASAVASKSLRDKLILETEMELKNSNDALAKLTKQLAVSKEQQETSVATIASLETMIAALEANKSEKSPSVDKEAMVATIVAHEREIDELKSQLTRITDKSRQRISHLEGMPQPINTLCQDIY